MSKEAETDIPEFITMLHAPVPAQAPDQPVNMDLGSAVAVNGTEVPRLNGVEHVAPQLIPAGVLLTVRH